MTKKRVQRSDLPNDFVKCAVPRDCPYMSSNGYCDDPRTTKGNSDAACHRMSNRALRDYLPTDWKPEPDEAAD